MFDVKASPVVTNSQPELIHASPLPVIARLYSPAAVPGVTLHVSVPAAKSVARPKIILTARPSWNKGTTSKSTPFVDPQEIGMGFCNRFDRIGDPEAACGIRINCFFLSSAPRPTADGSNLPSDLLLIHGSSSTNNSSEIRRIQTDTRVCYDASTRTLCVTQPGNPNRPNTQTQPPEPLATSATSDGFWNFLLTPAARDDDASPTRRHPHEEMY